ncbi:2-isopropylmalate synthase [Ferroacidibacillus organovorans]|uniref:2-isopropylmalate synthase n=1 Tax=Ferroacidibacillus organovorans TaxID=1765683 RepID=A0A853KG26_9BACL|nr:2-isopropylmalate synthase [Ferroacidibacillus organovorans]KYP80919.1 2-isopropylmalate synthase [Ferroacidibacillus organovorans]OAG95351.1 2-isopropylmalate synthase [Ferroacidibacillus organovorans]
MRRIRIFDTTLRDGEQSPGVTLTPAEKLEIARQLVRLRVDVIEAGYPAASPGDFSSVEAISRVAKGVTVCGLARAVQSDIQTAYDAIKEADDPRIHLFLATSNIHMEKKLRLTRAQVEEQVDRMVRFAATLTPNVQFSPEDGGRTDLDFLVRIVEIAIRAGAKVINIPDTVGFLLPSEYAMRMKHVRDHVEFGDVQLSAHCHDDLGLAVANSLAAISAGVDQVEGTINGIGERAGNASLEEIAVALSLRAEQFGASTNIDLSQIVRTSRLVSRLTGMVVPPNKAVVGANAFAHESGIHQDGVIKERTTYEIIDPSSVGLTENRSLVLGKHSGRHAFRKNLEEMGYVLADGDLAEVFKRFKALCDRKKIVTEEDILALVDERYHEDVVGPYALDYLHVSTGNFALATATVRVTGPDGVKEEAAVGNGGVEAIYNALDRVTGEQLELKSYQILSVTPGQDALGEVRVQIAAGVHRVAGRYVASDVLEASARAYLDAINRLIYVRGAKMTVQN